MHVSSWASWQLVVCVTAIGVAASKSSGVVEVDLVFPRNETYTPTPFFPVVFAVQNSELAPALNPRIVFTIMNWNDKRRTPLTQTYDLRWANFSSSDPYFEYSALSRFKVESSWLLTWTVQWNGCTEDSLSRGRRPFTGNYSENSIFFTTRNSTQEVDLIAATNEKDCAGDTGVTMNVTSTLDVPVSIDWYGGETCAVVPSPAPTSDPCRIKIDSAIASSISSSMTASWCRASLPTDPPISCPSKSAGQRLAIGRVACLAAAFGASIYIFL
ncbi:hypothetical protein K504DRAFT_489677 [Pleomassaria siparia CBS 279.74]|uniref:DUF7136 domain-containing protein n=1 Tax=Pleomassaria siparia CBS 279.74 TaxID=1314801 RepID=A0A6G1KHR3_9PLEO|nr:hypothetical protein K504DRAFT_489677 [Pleomassaria siparia CBS 279.74]